MREHAKVNRIVSEFMNFFESYHIHRYKMDISIAENKQATSVIKFTGKRDHLPERFIDDLNLLKGPRQVEFEYYYEDLLGVRDDSFSIEILSASIDYVTYTVTDVGFEILVERVYH
ncbi:hypothetical protein EF384_07060 [Aerococcus agrisoli]|uniref:Uncharacterized protein n=1 Tax=Aerococcus agrisoli TaxID=2487350 RepID=A0A3N4H141_9LACT|nr:hypothetical protein [Aerococcus agrisoli]RPA58924.1 hypothetical protein EF384_07060 [Aerococcus agrisoli]